MLCGVSHIVVPVPDLGLGLAFYRDALGFALLDEEDGCADLDGCGVTLRLLEAETPLPLALRLQTTQVSRWVSRLLESGATLLRPPADARDGERVAELRDPFGHRLILWRRLAESELESPPELPTTRPWREEAERVLKALLARVPEHFRAMARSGAVAEAELLCPAEDEVAIEHAVRAYIRATPRLMRVRLHRALAECGFDPAHYAEDFAC